MATSLYSNVSVEVKDTVDHPKGKGLFAAKQFQKGDVIFTETPLVSTQFSWNETYKYKACEYCLRSMETAQEMGRRLTNNPALDLPHPECCTVNSSSYTFCPDCQVPYCSSACLTAALKSYHKTLCLGPSQADPEHPVNKLQDTWRNIHYPPETTNIMLFGKMSAMVRQSDDPGSLLQKFSQFVQRTISEDQLIAHKLLGEEFESQLHILLEFSRPALQHEEVEQWFTPEGFRSIFAMIGTNGQGIGSSSISTWVKNCEKLQLQKKERESLDNFIDQLYVDLDIESGVFLNCEGSGLYELQSACNHSCVPNAEINFNHGDHTLTLTALNNIQPGEEISICYLDACEAERSRHSRQKSLGENYLFICHCPRCLEQADDPDVTSEEDMSEEEDVEEM